MIRYLVFLFFGLVSLIVILSFKVEDKDREKPAVMLNEEYIRCDSRVTRDYINCLLTNKYNAGNFYSLQTFCYSDFEMAKIWCMKKHIGSK